MTMFSENDSLNKADLQLVRTLAFGARMLSLDGHDDFNQGQVSGRRPGRNGFFVKTALRGFDEATPADMVWADLLERSMPDPKAPPELPLHEAIYKARPDVNGIVHSHAPWPLLFGATDMVLRPISHAGALFMGSTAVFTETSNTVLEADLADSIASALGDGITVFLRNHGSVVVGKSVRHAVVFAQMLEHACHLQILASQSKAEFHWASDMDVQAKQEFSFSDLSVRSYWDWSMRRVLREMKDVNDWP